MSGRHYLAIPGPSVVPDRILNAMHRASPDIYAGELHEIVPGIYEDLKKLARTKQVLLQTFLATSKCRK